MASLPTPTIPPVDQFQALARRFPASMAAWSARARDRFRSYLRTYPTLLAHFGKHPLTPHELQLGALATYAWMATTLIVREDITSDTVDAFERAREAVEPSGEDLAVLVRTFNNSLVGVSKMLHFAAPKRYPAWDSNVARAVYESGDYHVVSSVSKYRAYVTALRGRVAEDELAFAAIVQQLGRSLEDTGLSQATWSKLRAGELLLFVSRDG